jgi:hypothetical protein
MMGDLLEFGCGVAGKVMVVFFGGVGFFKCFRRGGTAWWDWGY